jgi:3-hydroxyisobutyrate dehydrogenase
MDLVMKDIGLFQKLAETHGVPLEISPLLIEIMADGQRRYGDRAQSDRIIERLEEATGLKILADGFPMTLIDDEPEEEGYESCAGQPGGGFRMRVTSPADRGVSAPNTKASCTCSRTPS